MIVVSCFLIVGSSCETEREKLPATAGLVSLDGELYQTIDFVNYYYSKSHSVHFCLHTKTSSAYYETWGTIQIESPHSSGCFQEISRIVIFVPELIEDGIGIVFKDGVISSFGKKETQDEYLADFVKTCTVKGFYYNTDYLFLSVEIVLTSNHTIEVLFSGPTSQTFVY